MSRSVHMGLALWSFVLVLAGSASGAKPHLGKPAPDFSLMELNGLNSEQKINLSHFRGRVVLLDFWASWCLPCRRLMPMLVAVKEREPDLEVLAVSIDEDRAKALSFLRDVVPGLQAVHDPKQKTAEAYGVNELMPACFLIDKDGRLRFRHEGYNAQDMETVEREAKLLLGEPLRK